MALFTDVFLYGFIVPILPYMLEDRSGLDPSKTQSITFALLSESALVGVVASPFIGQLADRTSHKKRLLLYSLGAAMGSSLGLALSRSAFLLFANRFVQAFASNSIFVLGLATIAENIPSNRMGQTMGLVTIAVSVGTSAGTMLAGILLELIGYWPTWCTAFALIAVDAVMRLLIVEKGNGEKNATSQHCIRAARELQKDHPDPEHSPLLPDVDDELHPPSSSSSSSCYSASSTKSNSNSSASSLTNECPYVEEKSGLSYYTFLIRQRRFVAGVTSYMCYSIIIASFDTTLPLHVRDAFNWGSLPSGLMFLALQGPGILLGPLAGWLKDRVGTRYPTAVAFLVIAPSIWLMGVPGDERFAWLNCGKRGEIVYIICMIAIGCIIPLLNSVGTLEVTLVVEEFETKFPGIFGPHGGNSRAVSIANMSWTLGIFIGPIISGTITDKIGYFEMNTILAVICLVSAVNAFLNLGPRKETALEM